jgi:WD40 repeat protein
MRQLIAVLVLLWPVAAGTQEMEPQKSIRRFGTTNLRYCADIFAFTPDGKAIAVVCGGGEKDSSVLIHDSRTGAVLAKLDPGLFSARALSFSPDGKRLLTSSRSGVEWTMWDVPTAKKLRSILGSSASFADQGRKIVATLPSEVGRRVLAIYDADTFAELRTVETSSNVIFSRDLEPTHSAREADGKWIIATHPEGKVVFSTDCGERQKLAQFHQDGALFIFSNEAGIHVWNVKTAQKVRSISAGANSAVVVSPDGKQLAWSGFDNHDGIAFVWVCDLPDGKPRHVGPPTNDFSAPQFSPDGKTLAFVTDSGALVLRDVATGKDVIQTRGHTRPIAGMHFTADMKHLVSRDRDAVIVWEVQTGKCARRFPEDLPAGERPIVGTLAQDFVITVAPDGTLRQRDLVTGGAMRVLAGKHGFVFGAALPAAVSADAAVLALVGKDYHIRAYELATGKILLDFDTPCAVWDVFLAHNGRYVSWISQNHPNGDDGVHYIEVATGKELERRELPAAAFPLGNEVDRWLPVADLKPRLADLKLTRPGGALSFDGPKEDHVRLALSRDGRFLMSRTLNNIGKGDDDSNVDLQREIGSLKIWEIAGSNSRLLPALTIRRDATEVAALSPDGRMLVTTTYDGRIHLWELATGRKRAVLTGHRDSVYAIAFSPDGRYLAGGGADGQVLLWDLWRR